MLEHVGFEPRWQFYLDELGRPELEPARVLRVDRGQCRLLTRAGERDAVWRRPLPVVGEASTHALAVGDWCAAADAGDRLRVEALLPRRTRLARARGDGPAAEQLLCANVDVVFVVTGLDGDFSVRRIERYLVLARSSGATPVVLLSKTDLCDEVRDRKRAVERAARGVPVIALCSPTGEGVAPVRAELSEGRTGVFLGSSGAGKSTLINCLLGEARLRTAAVRAYDDRGRHTTTHRELIALPGGGVVIDTPGIREVSVLGEAEDLMAVFPDVAELAGGCRFSDCSHGDDQGCAVRLAAEDGRLEPARYQSFLRLGRELESARRRTSSREQRDYERQTWGKYRGWLRQRNKLEGR